MMREESLQVLSVLKAAYPSAFKDLNKQDANGVITVWSTQFADTQLEMVLIAVNELIGKCKFTPSIAEVKETIADLQKIARDKLTFYRNYITSEEKAQHERILTLCSQCGYNLLT